MVAVVNPSVEIVNYYQEMEKTIERMGRLCYKSEDKITDTSHINLIRNIINKNHQEVLQHSSISIIIRCDRGITHEIVRHAHTAFAQTSTRYCDYSKGKFGCAISVIDLATGFKYDMNNANDRAKHAVWLDAMNYAEAAYMKLKSLGAVPQEARSVLPNSTMAELGITTNVSQWRHMFKMRVASDAHPQAVEVIGQAKQMFQEKWPVLFGDL